MREKIAERLYQNWQEETHFVYDYPWEEQPEALKNQHRLLADQILSALREEIEKCLLTDKEVRQVRFQGYFSEGYPLNATEESIKILVKKTAQAQLQAILKILE